MIGGLLQPAADIPGRDFYQRYGNVESCSMTSMFRDVWVFNPRGWTRKQILGDALQDYPDSLSDEEILPKRLGFDVTSKTAKREEERDQSFADFRLSDTPGGLNGLTIDSALEKGWECTGIQGNWCRKPFLPRHTKGPETVILCFEYVGGTETYSEEIYDSSANIVWGEPKTIPRRPRACTMEETEDSESNCICYLVNMSGQSGYKNQPGGTAFRPEVDYLEIRRADGTFGSDRPMYSDVTHEKCPDAQKTYEIDPDIVHNGESAVSDFTECTSCTGPDCNRHWKKRNLRKKSHEAGKIRYARHGFLSTLRGEAIIFGGECGLHPSESADGGAHCFNGQCYATHGCRMENLKTPNGLVTTNIDYMEKFVVFRMNKSGYLFGARRHVKVDGYYRTWGGRINHDESATSQHYSPLNTQIKFYE